MNDISATLAERGGRYGAFKDHAKIAQGLQEVLAAAPNWSKLDPDMRQALCVISDKIARILNGDPYYDDNWHDIQGYARLVEARIHKEREEAETHPKDSERDDNWEKDHSYIDWSFSNLKDDPCKPITHTENDHAPGAYYDSENKLYRS